MTSLRILAVSWTPLWPLHGGAALRAYALLSRLHGLELFCAAPGPLPPGFTGTAIGRRRWPAADFNPDVLNAVWPALRRAARRIASEQLPDAVLAFGIWSMPAALAAARGRPVVLDLAHVETATAAETRPGDPRVALLRHAERWAVRRAARVWAVSAEDRARLLELAPEVAPRTSVVPNGVDRLDTPSGTATPPVALFAGRLSFAPNRRAAEFLAREVAPRWRRGRLLLAGEGTERLHGSGVEIVSSPADMAPLYARARLACAPVFAGSGVRNKVLEAARYGLPLVATARAVEGLGYEPSVHYLRAETAGEFVSCFDALLEDAALGGGLVERSRRRVGAALLWNLSAAAARAALSELATSRPTGGAGAP